MASQNELSEIPGDYILGHHITTTRTSFIIPHQKGGLQSTYKALTQMVCFLGDTGNHNMRNLLLQVFNCTDKYGCQSVAMQR